jgi:hypothetical protein
VKNSARVRVGIHASSMVREVPTYREPDTAHVGTSHVGTDAFVRPCGPEVPGRSTVPATDESPAAAMAAHTYPARVETADVKTAHVGTGAFARPGGPPVPARSAVPATPPQRKPAESVKPAPKDRKNAAHRASGG